MVVSQRAEDAFLAYIYELARQEAASSRVREDESDETSHEGPAGPQKKG